MFGFTDENKEKLVPSVDDLIKNRSSPTELSTQSSLIVWQSNIVAVKSEGAGIEGVGVGVNVEVAVAVGMGVKVAVAVGVGVKVAVGEGLGVAPTRG